MANPSLSRAATLALALAPLDVASPALGALPGDSRAIDSSLRETLIEPRGALQVTLTQHGQPVSMVDPDAHSVQLEVPLAPDQSLAQGDRFSLWSFDATGGLWRQQFPDDAKVKEPVEGRFVAVGVVSGPGWWTVARRTDATACLCGQVEDASVAPATTARIASTPGSARASPCGRAPS